jgi:hypothetical protein
MGNILGIGQNKAEHPDIYRSFQKTDGWHVVDDDDYRQAVGKPQAKGMMSTAASFSLS